MNLLTDNDDGQPTIILAHGAGAPMDSPFMEAAATGLAGAGLKVVRFEFPYMAKRREDGKKRGPNGAKILSQAWRDVVAEVGRADELFIGGKSMGGRYASMLADEIGPRGLVCLGYPFHPPYKPDKLRTAHLEHLQTPALIVQGTRDPFGKPDEVAGYALSESIDVVWVDAGDHSLVPTKRSGRTEQQNIDQAVRHIVDFIGHH